MHLSPDFSSGYFIQTPVMLSVFLFVSLAKRSASQVIKHMCDPTYLESDGADNN